MHDLNEREIYQALQYAKSIDDETGRKILEQFQLDQTALAQIIFGALPSQSDMDINWLEKQTVLLDTELQALMTDKHMDDKFMNAAIDDFVSESQGRVKAIHITQTMIYVVVRLFCSLYAHAGK